MVQDYESRISPVIEVRPGARKHDPEGFEITALVSNHGKESVRLDRFELLWWLSDDEQNVKSTTAERGETLRAETIDQPY